MAHDIFKQLIEINTTDSIGSTTVAAQAMAQRLLDGGFPAADVTVIGPNERKGNLIARYRGKRGKALRPILIIGHLDVVEARREDWTTDPFQFVEKDGYFYGRGAQDMKGGLAAILSAAEILARRGLAAGRVVVAAVADEEHASIGASELVKRWTADAAIVTEPTDLAIGVAHKGFSWIEVETLGRAAHGSQPADGEDAILRMGRVLGWVESLNAELASRPAHPLLGPASLHGSLIEGGRELSTYPDRCVLQLERRTLPGEAPDAALSELRGILESLAREDSAFRSSVRHLFSQPPYATPAGSPIVEDLASVLASAGREVRREGMSFWTDAAILGSAGIPSVVFGPGGSGLHGLEEYVRTDEVVLCRDVLVETAIRCCAGQPG